MTDAQRILAAWRESINYPDGPPLVIHSADVAVVEVELEELAFTTELFMKCLDRAQVLWQEAHPESKLVWPDGAKNIVWLLEQNEALTAKVAAEYEARLKGRVVVEPDAWQANNGRWIAEILWQCADGETLEEAVANLDRLYFDDKEEANHG
jgi:hypothetical protein